VLLLLVAGVCFAKFAVESTFWGGLHLFLSIMDREVMSPFGDCVPAKPTKLFEISYP